MALLPPKKPKRIVKGFAEILYRLSTIPRLAHEQALDMDDYMLVVPPLPLAEFSYPFDILESFHFEPNKFGKVPRTIKRYDIISLVPTTRHPSIAMLVIDELKDTHLFYTGCQVQSHRSCPLSLMPLQTRIESFYKTRVHGFGNPRLQ